MTSACTSCAKSPPEVELKRCAKCSTTPYCSRDCQKSDWKAHKKVCSKQAGSKTSSWQPGGIASQAGNLSPPKGLRKGVVHPFTRLDKGTWLHDRPDEDVYGLLIDAYRLRMEDEYTMEGDADADSIYGGAPDGLRGFQRFLKRAASRPGLLPGWWSAAKQRSCEQLGMTRGEWYDLSAGVEKSDIIEHYGESRFPMQLRMFAEAVYGRGPGGSNGTAMRQMMMRMEQQDGTEDMHVDAMDISAFVRDFS